MRSRLIVFVAALVVLALPQSLVASDQVSSSKAACRFLIKTGQKAHLALEQHPGVYYCGVPLKKGEYFVIDLHRTDETAPKDWMGSTLVGYYGVRAKDGVVVEWDVIDDVPREQIKERNPKMPILEGSVERSRHRTIDEQARYE